MWGIKRSARTSILIWALLLGLGPAACDHENHPTYAMGVINKDEHVTL